MSVIHNALREDHEGASRDQGGKQVSRKAIHLESKLTTPTEKWFELYKQIDKEAVLRSKKPKRKKVFSSVSKYLAKSVYVGLILFAVVLVLGGLTAFRFLSAPSLNSSPNPGVVQAFPQQNHLQAERSATNPMRAMHGAPQMSVAPELVLTGIFEGTEKIALINNKAVGEGDYIGNILVKEIQGRRVILEFQGKEAYLVL